MGSPGDLRARNDAIVAKASALAKREAILRTGLHPLYKIGYALLCDALKDTFWAPYFGYRTFKEQAALYAQGRTAPGEIVTKAQGPDSAHCWGCASDWMCIAPGLKGKQVWDLAPWKEFGDAVAAAGLRWGAEFGDQPHAELRLKPGLTWKKIGQIYAQEGRDTALLAIEKGALCSRS